MPSRDRKKARAKKVTKENHAGWKRALCSWIEVKEEENRAIEKKKTRVREKPHVARWVGTSAGFRLSGV